MLRSNIVLAGLTASVLCVSSIGCGDSGGTGGAGGQASQAGAQPPGPPSGAKAGDGTGKAFGVSKLYIGTTDRSGAESPTAWENYGYNLDNQITTTDYTKHCKANGGASPADTFKDGKDGRDNAFGKSLLPIIKSAAMGTDLQASVNKALTDGTFTIIVDIADLGDGKDYNPLKAYLLAGKERDATNTWKIVPELLDGTTPDTSKVKFLQSYLTNNTWVSGSKGKVSLSLSVAGFSLSLDINSAVIAMDLDGTHANATNGTIAGVLNTEQFITELQKVVGAFDPSLCTGPTVDSILNRIRQASDIMSDGTQDPSKTCDGISIGIGFDATNVNIGGLAAAAMPQPDPCMTTSSTSSSSSTGTGSSSASTGTGM